MCGIIAGASSRQDIKSEILHQLQALEYRGYDSSGVALLDQTAQLHSVHSITSIEALTKQAKQLPECSTAIAHTRWATHGKVCLENAHPHLVTNSVAAVHNGIIENHETLRTELCQLTQCAWRSDTDSEVIIQWIHYLKTQGSTIENAILQTVKKLTGTYALAVIDTDNPGKIYCIAKDSSLIIGKSKCGYFVCSDQSALSYTCEKACPLPQSTLFTITAHSVSSQYNLSQLSWLPLTKPNQKNSCKKTNNITLDEIYEQPQVLETLINRHIERSSYTIIGLPDGLIESVRKASRIILLACGSSYYCAKVGKYWLERIAKKPVVIDLASEYRYREPIVEPGSLVVTLSQSGETLDTLSALRFLQKTHKGIISLSIGNNSLSSLAQESTYFWPTLAGPEIGVATTKVFCAQLFCLLVLTAHLCTNKSLSVQLVSSLLELPKRTRQVLTRETTIQKIAQLYKQSSALLFCARGINYPIAQEASLKLKELAYVHTSAYAAGELKHGPLALIEERLTTVFFVNKDQYFEKIKSNISEVITRKGKVLLIGPEDILALFSESKQIYKLASCTNSPSQELSPWIHLVSAQLLTYHIAKIKGCTIDKPRNLAKCVTVE